MKTFNLQNLSLLYNIIHNLKYLPRCVTFNNMIHLHNVTKSGNIHINTVFTLDQCNFMYYCINVLLYFKLEKLSFTM